MDILAANLLALVDKVLHLLKGKDHAAALLFERLMSFIPEEKRTSPEVLKALADYEADVSALTLDVVLSEAERESHANTKQ